MLVNHGEDGIYPKTERKFTFITHAFRTVLSGDNQ